MPSPITQAKNECLRMSDSITNPWEKLEALITFALRTQALHTNDISEDSLHFSLRAN